MQRSFPHINSIEHLGAMVNEALFYTRDGQDLQVTLVGVAIKSHVDFMKTTEFSAEVLQDMILAAILLAKKCTPFINKQNIGTIMLCFAELIADLSSRSAGEITHVTLANLQEVIEGALRTPSRDSILENVFSQPLLSEEDVADVIKKLDDHFLELMKSRA